MKELIEEITRALVDEPARVSVNEVAGISVSIYELSVAKEDIGKIVGRHGGNLAALRTIMAAVGSKLDRKAIVEVVE